MNKLIIIKILTVFALQSQAGLDVQRYCYIKEPSLTTIVNAPTWEDGRLQAGRSCFKALTEGKYPGEARGLEIIDTCANPRRCD